jgi:hypothetical protein
MTLVVLALAKQVRQSRLHMVIGPSRPRAAPERTPSNRKGAYHETKDRTADTKRCKVGASRFSHGNISSVLKAGSTPIVDRIGQEDKIPSCRVYNRTATSRHDRSRRSKIVKRRISKSFCYPLVSYMHENMGV